MSRIIVKNLPRRFSEERFHEVFSSQGDITDARLMFTPEGKFRRFGFVGYRNAEDAQRAVEYYNKSFLESFRLQVDHAIAYGDKSIPRPWSRHSTGSSAFKKASEPTDEDDGEEEVGEEDNSDSDDDTDKKEKRKKKKKSKDKGKADKVSKSGRLLQETLGLDESDPKLQEFMSLYERGEKGKTWSNDAGGVGDMTGAGKVPSATGSKARAGRGGASDSDSSGDESGSDTAQMEGSSFVGQDSSSDVAARPSDDAALSSVSDLQYLRSKMSEGAASDSNETADSSSSSSSSSSSEDEAASSSRQPVAKHPSACADSTSSSSDDEDDDEDGAGSDADAENKERLTSTVKMTGLPYKSNEGAIRSFFAPLRVQDVRIMLNKDKKPSGIAFVDFARAADVQKALRRNRKRLGGRYIELVSERILQDKRKTVEEEKLRAVLLQDKRNRLHAASQTQTETIAESGRLFVTNLTYGVTEEEVKTLFQERGPLSEVVIPIDKKTKKAKGVAIVTYLMPEHAVTAFNELEGSHFQGRVLHLQPAKTKVAPSEDREEVTSSYKKKKAASKKASAQNWTNWNSLFLGADAAAEGIAAKYGTTKAHVLDAEGSGSLAVRLALGETNIVGETRQFLLEHGVKLDALTKLQKNVGRSSTAILVKDLPHGTKSSQLHSLFSPFGELVRVVLPPSGVSGIVEFSAAVEAKAAFSKLAYSQYVDRPLYLEWAPDGVFTTDPPAKESDGEDEEDEGEELPDAEGSGDQQSTLFVKNLNFKTTEDTLLQVFSEVGTVQKATIAKKRDPKHPGGVLSMGFGFLEFKQREHALEALKKYQKRLIDGHNVDLKMSGRTSSAGPKSTKRARSQSAPSSKILVRNVPFEANPKEIRELFKAFGEIKSVRMPKKTGTHNHRGFGFVDFLSKQEAQRAFEALSHSTHLYGRRLVLEWASQDETVDNVRLRTAKHFHEPLAKRSKVEIDSRPE